MKFKRTASIPLFQYFEGLATIAETARVCEEENQESFTQSFAQKRICNV